MNSWIIGQDKPENFLKYFINRASFDSTPPLICFDYFDTLVVRCVEPEYTKRMAAHLLCRLLRNGLSGEEIYRFRQKLEKELCDQSVANQGDPDFNLVELSPLLFQQISSKGHSLPGWSEESFTEAVLNIEVTVENLVQDIQIEMVQVLRRLKEKDIKTILVSDFYLPEVYYRQMLIAHKLESFFDHIFISADHKMMKGTGRLYKKICDELDCRPDQLIMIGDNEHADINMARSHGIETIHVQNPAQQHFYNSLKQKRSTIGSRVDKQFESALESVKQNLFFEIGSSLWFFIYLLFNQLVRDQVKNIFFFSKEGQFLSLLFNKFQQEIFGHTVIKSHYIIVSRKATFLASLRPIEQEDFMRLFAHYRDISLRDFLLSLNFEENVAEKICLECELDFSTRFMDLRNHPQFLQLLKNKSFQDEYEYLRLSQKKNFITYLKSFGVDFEINGLQIVDVGWKGSIQDNIYYILDEQVKINGYYIGSLIATEKKKNNLKMGVLFSDSPSPTPYFNIYNCNRSLFEMVLGASHGSADGYYTQEEYKKKCSEKKRSVFKTIRYKDIDLNIVVLDYPEERKLYNEVIKPLQDSIFSLFCEMNKAYVLSDCRVPDKKWFARQHARMVYKPRCEEVVLFEELYHLENFGIFEYTDFRSDILPSWKERISHLKNIIRDPNLLETGIWPPIILRRLGLGFIRSIDGWRRYRRELR